jgi:hypothetical protein
MRKREKQAITFDREEIKGPAIFSIVMGAILLISGMALITVGLIELFSGRGVRYLVFGFGLGALITAWFGFYLARKLYQRSRPPEQ